MKLRMLLLLSFMTLGLASARATDTAPFIEVWKSATGSCCGAWVKHLEANGFTVKVNAAEAGPLAALKREAGIGDKLASCYTAKIDDYVIEGHVPGTDIKRLIAERPEAIGLTVSGMPAGSPGIAFSSSSSIRGAGGFDRVIDAYGRDGLGGLMTHKTPARAKRSRLLPTHSSFRR